MFDIGWQELFVIAVVTVVVIGPKELPRTLRSVMGWVRKARLLAREFQDGVDDMVREADLEDIKRELEKAPDLELGKEFQDVRELAGEVKKNLDVEAEVKKHLDVADQGARRDGSGTGASAQATLPEVASPPPDRAKGEGAT